MTRDISMNTKARNVSDAGGISKNRTYQEREREGEETSEATAFLAVQGMSGRLGSEVEYVQSLIMTVARKETPTGNRACV